MKPPPGAGRAPGPDSHDTLLEIGYVARARGLAGELIAQTHDPSSEALFEVDNVVVRPRKAPEKRYAVRDAIAASKQVRLWLEGVTDRAKADALVGATLLVSREELPSPEAGEYYLADLIGLTAIDEEGRALGTVAEVWSHGEVPNLVIRREAPTPHEAEAPRDATAAGPATEDGAVGSAPEPAAAGEAAKAEGDDELIVPFADAFVPEVDLAGRRITVRPPEYV